MLGNLYKTNPSINTTTTTTDTTTTTTTTNMSSTINSYPLLVQPITYPIFDVSKSHCSLLPKWIARCRSMSEIQQALIWSHSHNLPTKPIGCGHSWSEVSNVAKNGVLIDTRSMSRLLWIENNTVCVQPGMSLRDLTRHLSKRNLCLPSLPVLLRQTVGGAVSTGSHGSSLMHGTLSDSISSLVVVSNDGQNIEVLKDTNTLTTERLRASRMGLGCMGVLVEIRLKVVNMYRIYRNEHVISMKRNYKYSINKIIKQLALNNEHCWIHW